MESVKSSLSVACGAVYLAADSRGQRHSKKGAALCAVRISHAEERRLIPSFFLRDGRYEAAMFFFREIADVEGPAGYRGFP